MALDFTGIKDEHGAAILLLHDGTALCIKEFEALAHSLKNRTKKQIIVLSAKDTTGGAIINFYGLKGTKFVLVVRDDDQLHHVWSDGERFDPAQIAYIAEQAG